MYARILVPVDGSDTAARGMEEALSLARELKSTLVLVHVIDPVPLPMEAMSPGTWQEMSESLRQRGQAVLDAARDSASNRGVPVQVQLVEEHAQRVGDTLVAQVQAQRCDLVVMGTHGRRGLRHLMLGSDAEHVLRRCGVPVLLVRHPEAGAA